MIDINELNLNTLSAVRQRLGGINENDTEFDEKIKKMTPLEITRKYRGWMLGDEGWANDIIGIYNNAIKAEKK